MTSPFVIAALILGALSLPPRAGAQDGRSAAGNPAGASAVPEAALSNTAGSEDAAFPDISRLSVGGMLRAARGQDLLWRPDSPLDMPPDLFRVTGPDSAGPRNLPAGDIRSIDVDFEDGETAGLSGPVSAVWGNGPYLSRFPVFLGGAAGPEGFLQAQAEFDASGGLRIIRITGGDFTAEFLEESLVRVNAAGSYYFVVLEDGPRRISETWYDPAGRALFIIMTEDAAGESLRISFQDEAAGAPPAETRYYYDGAGAVTGISSPAGEWSVLYDALGRPRYWERRPSAAAEASSAAGGGADPDGAAGSPGNYIFQWDERGLLVRFHGGPPGEAENGIDCRYEYTLDQRGNWTERRETRMIPRSGRLVPVPGRTLRRCISYAPARTEDAAEGAGGETP
ncbi:MAG: hypothetical protein LBJ24_01335 [Treponema sp.]|jgi:YD repeat-containing protein|nr:hypothetical protein [Treponema sp.]